MLDTISVNFAEFFLLNFFLHMFLKGTSSNHQDGLSSGTPQKFRDLPEKEKVRTIGINSALYRSSKYHVPVHWNSIMELVNCNKFVLVYFLLINLLTSGSLCDPGN